MERYQDYVIKDGKFIGKFEEMYQKFDDPWHQKENLNDFYSRMLTPVTLRKYQLRNVVEIGCGLGAFTNYLNTMVPDCSITGMDISETAIKRAQKTYPDITFVRGGVLEFSKEPCMEIEAIIFSEIMWYILEDIDDVIIVNELCLCVLHPNPIEYKATTKS